MPPSVLVAVAGFRRGVLPMSQWVVADRVGVMTENAFVEGEPTAEQQRLIDVGTELFRRIQPDAELGFRLLPEDDAVVVVHKVRGGGSIYVAADESALFAASAVAPH